MFKLIQESASHRHTLAWTGNAVPERFPGPPQKHDSGLHASFCSLQPIIAVYVFEISIRDFEIQIGCFGFTLGRLVSAEGGGNLQ